MTHIITLDAHGADSNLVEWASQYPDFVSMWNACNRPDWMLWLHESGIITMSDSDLRLFACDCVRYTPIGDGRTTWDLVIDGRSRNAVEVAERFATGQLDKEELDTVWNSVKDVIWNGEESAMWDAVRSAVKTVDSAWYSAWYSVRYVSRAAARHMIPDGERDMKRFAEFSDAWNTASKFQADLLRKRVGNPFL